ncbi:MAG: hypothetical protein KAS98_16555 [Deltaproteobacteria bacterium]|nr:hypothetical protein [Deltaproteobacteria bacterium]
MMKRYGAGLLLVAIILFIPFISFSLTVDEVIKLKKAGVSDETIQLMIQHKMMSEKLSDPYKNIGVRKVKEPDGSSATVYSTGEIKDRGDYEEESERGKREKAWDMLDNLVIDGRDGGEGFKKGNEKKER